ncbi:carbohydrate kinase [Natrialba chahannaoensis JCM 10990]|uniref:ADP-dependent (S)-NAD(P)H-hydrate dehydratase n=1 Tax=Natrialba chahannaoensis JCM 10990 TaxID=1227492 RepID=M0B4Z2_9EURY|nr:NAD(P)H-hydrate dehydratase [Natrialba chahannaoensis]ELZ05333.1 carbohydrate kinase [Natrialba chahannaoensis JCM 10990]
MGRLQRTLSNISETSDTDNGRVAVAGGSIDYPNQPVLVGRAALRTGTDHVRVLVPDPLYGPVAGSSPNLLVSSYEGDQFDQNAADDAGNVCEWADALVIGPGLVDADTDALRDVLERTDIPVVVDALAIEPALESDLSTAVLTPSESEDDPIYEAYGSLEAFTEETDAVITLTGGVDEIVTAGERLESDTGTSALTVAGTGDTLAGITASLLGQGMDRQEAAELGAWILGKSGELATTEYGPGVIATDVIECIPKTIR